VAEHIRFALKLNMYGHPVDTRFRDFISIAVAAEELGFDAAYTIDHFFLPGDQTIGFSEAADPNRPFFPEAWTSLAALATATTTLRIGPQVAPVMRYNPAMLARFGANLDFLSDGRFVLQLGTGWNPREYSAYGLPYVDDATVQHELLQEGMQVIDALWTTDGPVSFVGKHYRLDDAPMWPKPVQRPRPPIWLGGSGRRTRQAVAAFADAWTPAAPHYTGLTPEFYTRGLADIRAQATQMGRDPAAIMPAALFFVVLEADNRQAQTEAEKLRRRSDWASLSVAEMNAKGIALVGDPEECIANLRRFTDIGVRYFTLGFVPIASAETTIRRMTLFAKEVMPAFRE
jgi:alkanesulfonate monooxygenase SsuD/methylene tetrahydromethanopterin reductase-like flavin-dependent oxidoreductase (luciferase family)